MHMLKMMLKLRDVLSLNPHFTSMLMLSGSCLRRVMTPPWEPLNPLNAPFPCCTVIYFLMGVPLSHIFWYRTLYDGARENSTFGYLGFFLMFAVHLGFCIWAAIGAPSGPLPLRLPGF